MSDSSHDKLQSFTSDEVYARSLQAEEHAAADRIAAALVDDAKLALDLSESDSPARSLDPSPNSAHAPPSPSSAFVPATLSRPAFATNNHFEILLHDQYNGKVKTTSPECQPKTEFLLKVPVPVSPDPTAVLEKEMNALEAELRAGKQNEREQARKDRVARDERRRRDATEDSRSAESSER